MDESPNKTHLILAVVAASIAAIAFPDAHAGLNLVLIGGLVIASAIATRRQRPGRYELLLLGFAGSLLISALVTDAAWVIVLCALSSIALVGHALRAGATASETIRDLAAAFLRIPLAVGYWLRPLTSWFARRTGRDLGPLARGTAVAGVLVCVFGILFVSADAAFARIAEDLLSPSWDIEAIVVRTTIAMCVLLLCGSLALTAASDTAWGGIWGGPRARIREPQAIEWLLPLGSLNVLFAAFVTVQFTTLFGSHHFVLHAVDLTYAEYAREGFFQLILAAGLTLAVVWAVRTWVGADARKDVRLRLLLSSLGGMTLVILASALARLTLYEEAFGFTRVRITAHAIILWLAAILIVVIVGVLKGDMRWMPRTVVCLSAAAMTLLGVMRPDALVADGNVSRWLRTGKVDIAYLSTLSSDAVPALIRLDPPLRDCALQGIATRLDEPETWLEWNLSRADARGRLSHFEVDRDAVC